MLRLSLSFLYKIITIPTFTTFLVSLRTWVSKVLEVQSEVKLPKRRRKIIVVKKSPTNGSGTKTFDNKGTRHQRGAKVLVKRVRKVRGPRKVSSGAKDGKVKFPPLTLLDNITRELIMKSSG